MLPALSLMLACGNPISNQLLYEDEEFLAALPSSARLAPPSEVRLARVGTSALLGGAVAEAAALDALGAAVAASGEALRGATPDDRSEVRRGWKPVSAALKIEDKTRSWFVKGEVLRPLDTTDLDWTIEVSADGEAPWAEVGSGTWDPSGTGSFTWDVATHAALLGVEPAADVLSFEIVEGDEAAPRELLVEVPDAIGLSPAWHGIAEELLIWTGEVSLSTASEPAPGAAQVWHVPELGGRAFGSRFTAGGEVPFEVCWDANGNDTWVTGGDTGEIGSASACALEW